MSMDDIVKNATDDELKQQIKSGNENIAHMQLQIDVYRDIVKAHQAELDRRALNAYWQAHPDLVRLEVGDKLLITSWYNASYGQIRPELTHHSPIGSTTTIDQIYIASFGDKVWRVRCINDMDGCISPGILLTTAIELRQAYLAREAT